MFRSITTYSRGDLVIEVRSGESHSPAWAAITGATPLPPTATAAVHACRRCERRRPRSRGRLRTRRGAARGIAA
jgi:hypothetical protein